MEIIGQPLLRSPGRRASPCSLRTLSLRQAPSLGGVAQVVLNPLLLCCGLHSTTRDGLHDDIEELENRCGLAAPFAPIPFISLRFSDSTRRPGSQADGGDPEP